MSREHPVRTLSPDVARKIAAGEVIDRPNSIIRELLDNAVDSGATSITAEISGGGIEKIRIVDNGCGMTREDLESCARPHSTSKITDDTDLLRLRTLGFRGEALSSIAAVARLSVTSGGWRMRASITEDHLIDPASPVSGCIVQTEGLFANIPARRVFLKKPATEAAMCRNTFCEKAMARPDISFRLISDGELKSDLPACGSLAERFVDAAQIREDRKLFHEVTGRQPGQNSDWKFTVVIGDPAVSRTSKKDILIYVNGRRITEYALVQAVEYGCQGFFPNGTYPVAAVFIEINPELVDFNIHPAKREVRFYDISELHHELNSSLRNFMRNHTRMNYAGAAPESPLRYPAAEFEFNGTAAETPRHAEIRTGGTGFSGQPGGFRSRITYRNEPFPQTAHAGYRAKYPGLAAADRHTSAAALAEQALASFMDAEATEDRRAAVKFIGCTLGTFILAEKENSLYIIDQHAAHERIIFDSIMGSQGRRQELLIPYRIRTGSDADDRLMESLKDELTRIGFSTARKDDSVWEITSVPERWTGGSREFENAVLRAHVLPEEIIRAVAAMTACKAAVKDGYILDDETAAGLAEQALLLPDPHCPHGRPVYTVISREQLFAMVKRT